MRWNQHARKRSFGSPCRLESSVLPAPMDVSPAVPYLFAIITDLHLPICSTQEIVFSLDISLICGNFELCWVRFAVTITRIWQNAIRDSIFRRFNIQRVQDTVDIWTSRCLPGKFWHPPEMISKRSILDLILHLFTYECTDPRDRIFALHSFAEDSPIQTKIN